MKKTPVEPLVEGRDELNFAEHALALLTDKRDESLKSITFRDTILDESTGELVRREVEVIAGKKYGLPTPLDLDVLVALVSLTKFRNNFTDPKLTFTRYELLKLLRWKGTGENYERLEEALFRWLSVTVEFRYAWRDKANQMWKPHVGIHFYRELVVWQAEDRRRLIRRGQDHLAVCSLIWDETVFASFQAEYIKKLDLNLYFSLRTPTARRLYRFLDKRLYRNPSQEFDLHLLAFEKIGMSRNYKVGKIKQVLDKAIGELVKYEFIEHAPPSQRYRQVTRGEWKVRFKLKVKTPARPAATQPPPQPTASPASPAQIQKRIDAYWDSLTPAEQEALDREAEACATGELPDIMKRRPLLARVMRRTDVIKRRLGIED